MSQWVGFVSLCLGVKKVLTDHNQTDMRPVPAETVTHWHGGAGAVALGMDRQSLENEGGGSPQTHSECEYTIRHVNFFLRVFDYVC